ncbi:MAG: hypothetical protein H7Y13_11160 [Sphingobacteriaceae bacterium]|nr:hypothetical protein [Sphingobacteriaceae bacterium]
MAKLIFTCGFFLFVFSVSISYASNGKPSTIEKTDRKQACKTSERLIPEKLLKIKPLDFKTSEKSSAASAKSPATANTFETLITPFLKAVAPHFYDQIIKKEQKPSPVQS